MPSHTGCMVALDTEDRHFRRVDDRREAGAADVAETGDGEAGALHGIGRELCCGPCRPARRPRRPVAGGSSGRHRGSPGPAGRPECPRRSRCTYSCGSAPCRWGQRTVEVRQFLSRWAQALSRIGSTVSLTPAFSAAAFWATRKASMSVMSDWSNWVTCGTFSQLRCRLAAPTCIRRVIATSSTSPNLLKSTSGIGGIPAPPVAPAPPDLARCSCSLTKTWTSSLRMRPLGPLAFTSLSSTPNSRASMRTAGPAWTLAPSRLGAPTGAGVSALAGAGPPRRASARRRAPRPGPERLPAALRLPERRLPPSA